MSGIAGIVHFDGSPVVPGLIEGMTAAMAHRGPDGISHWRDADAALGFCKLDTTPESPAERQPLVCFNGELVLVMDGRLENWPELRRELLYRGCTLRDSSDAELVLHAYITWGTGCLSRIRGDFAIAIWNRQAKRIFCVRDPLGNKPFYYFSNGKRLIFATELHAILTIPGVPQVLHEGTLAQYLVGEWYSREDTFWRDICRLVAAHYLVADHAGARKFRYWSPDLFATLSYRNDDEYVEHYRELLFDTVRRLSRSHRPISCEVSGGLDSSAIFSVGEYLRREGGLLSPAIQGYTLDFRSDPDADEIDYARAVGEFSGTSIREVPPCYPPLTWYFGQARKYRDFPGYPNGVMSADLMRLASEAGSRVLFNGVGGDQWLGASPLYINEELAAKRYGVVHALVKNTAASEGWPEALMELFRYGIGPWVPKWSREGIRKLFRQDFHQRERVAWLKPRLRRALNEQRRTGSGQPTPRLRWPGQASDLAKLLDSQMDIAHETQERLAAMYGLELRRPYYNTAVVEFFFAVPKRVLFSNATNRVLHRRALQGILPPAVLERQTKAEFSVTYEHYLSAMRERLMECSATVAREWIDHKKTIVLYNRRASDHYAGWSSSTLWALFGCCCLWQTG